MQNNNMLDIITTENQKVTFPSPLEKISVRRTRGRTGNYIFYLQQYRTCVGHHDPRRPAHALNIIIQVDLHVRTHAHRVAQYRLTRTCRCTRIGQHHTCCQRIRVVDLCTLVAHNDFQTIQLINQRYLQKEQCYLVRII